MSAEKENEDIYLKLKNNPNNLKLWKELYKQRTPSSMAKDLDFNTLCLINENKSFPAWNYRRQMLKEFKIEDQDFLIEILKLDSRNYHAWNYLMHLDIQIVEFISLLFFLLDETNYSARNLLTKTIYYLSDTFYMELTEAIKQVRTVEGVSFSKDENKIFIPVYLNLSQRIYISEGMFEILHDSLFKRIEFFRDGKMVFENKTSLELKFMLVLTDFIICSSLTVKINNLTYTLKNIETNVLLLVFSNHSSRD
ncbi:hypothetical protein CDIK_1442 [Cucumispora dikerogammari]|nr:hypothetical protein CDIK_1442 [Cucumispora dikerogammari]